MKTALDMPSLPVPASSFAGQVVLVAGRSRAADCIAEAFRSYACTVLRLGAEPADGDLANPDAIRAAFDAFAQSDRLPHILVHAGAAETPPRLLDTSGAQWRSALATEYDAPFFVASEFARRRIAAGGGGAVLDVHTGAGGAHDEAAAGGLANQVRCLALEWARDGLRVNGLACRVADAVLEGATAQALCCAVLYLCSPYAAYVTGHTMTAF